MKLISKLSEKKQIIYITLILALWAIVIFEKYGGQSLLIHYLWPLITGGTFILFISKKWLKNKVSWIHVFALLGLGIFLLTFLFDLSPSDGSLELMNIGFGITLAIILSNVKWNDKTFRWLFAGIIMVVCFMDLWGIISYAAGHPFNRLIGPLVKPNEAFSGFPNLAANLNLLALIPAFYFFINAHYKSRIVSLGIIIANIVILGSLFLTYSRAAWFAAIFIFVAVLLALYIKFWKNRRVILKFIINSAFVILLSIALFVAVNHIRSINSTTINAGEKIVFQSEDEGSSVDERIASIERGLQMTLKYPITGVGAGSFNYISQSYEQNFYTLSSYPYSLPVKLLAEHGILAFSLIVLWIVALLAWAFKKEKDYKIVAALTVVALLIHHTMDNNFDFFAASLPTFLILGMIWPDIKAKSLFKNIWVLIIVSILTVSGIIFVGYEGYYGTFYIKGRNAAGSENHKVAVEEYSKSFNMIFKRDARLATANSYFELYKNLNQKKYLNEAQNLAIDYLAYDNPLDKRGALFLAKTFAEQNNYTDCLKSVDLATKMGGQNDFEIDYYRLTCTNDLYKRQNLIDSLISKLEKYYELLKLNAHMTVLTDNPKFAVKILDIISTENPAYLPLYYDMLDLAVSETEKFHNKYGIDAEINF